MSVSAEGQCLSLIPRRDAESNKRVKEVICSLVGYLLAVVSRSESEWRDWSRPFLSAMYISQFGEAEGTDYFVVLDDRLCPLIGKEKSLWITNTSFTKEDEDQDYLMVKHAEQHLLEEFAVLDPHSIDEEIPKFVESFSQLLLSRAHYDGRMRTIIQKLCRMLHASVKQFSEQEKAQFQAGDISADFSGDFKRLSDAIPRQSLLVQYRMWRVGLVAAGGGAMVGLAGIVAAPTIMANLLPLMTSAMTFTQISVTMETFLVYTGGVVTYPWIPSLFTAYGATVAGRCMLERTKEMQEFELLPLHIPTAHDSIHGSKFALNADSSLIKGGPLYILVPGHLDKNVDVRALWGANGSVLLLDDDHPASESSVIQAAAEDNKEMAPNTAEEASSATQQVHKSIVRDVIEHEIHALKEVAVKKIEQEIELQTNSFPEFIRNEVHILTQAAESKIMNTEFDVEEEQEWEQLKVRYQGWWRDLVSLGEEYVLRWETDLLELLNDSLMDIILDQIKAKIFSKIKDALLNFAASAIYPLKKAMALPDMVLAKIKELDGAWLRAMDKARQGGQLMARTLLAQKKESASNNTFRRPVTLIGYGMGARLIFHCLEYLHDHGGEDGKGIVEHAILLGAPVPTFRSSWLKARAVVANRLVNCYARFDWILALLYRMKSYDVGVAGLYPVFINEDNHRHHEQTLGKIDESSIVQDPKKIFEEEMAQEMTQEYANNATENIKEEVQSVPVVLPDFAAAKMEYLQEVENIDITHIVSVHSDYPKLLYTILDLVKL